ncbi:hypothetical protein Poli38472_013914 [Pythium oligandrum]|uniref:Vacuolar protein 8 n=1 Tax=Pythium oligandrum TaxID=41045 RepID=A0A8K1C2W0_PYTOL|nr:hypothetical protein Poli38472_013914 [Pythium oligandrum]|eukprot:TMW55152.1 hypothetical protein Poli38472_013914 [Pythium oligandrum]
MEKRVASPLNPIRDRANHIRAPSPAPSTPFEDRDVPALSLELKLPFQYKGDVFSQHGSYTDASLYLSRLPSSRKGAVLRPKAVPANNMQIKLAPMQRDQDEREPASVGKPNHIGRRRQYAQAVEAMAANPMLHSSLLNDNIVTSVLALCRTKDSATLTSCVTILTHLSCEPLGRDAILQNPNALTLLTTLNIPVSSSDKRLQHNYLALLANLTIEDSFEAVLVKEKVLSILLQHRKSVEAMCVFALFNLSCPVYSYPRIDDVIRALQEYGRTASDRDLLSRGLYNLSSTRVNQLKLVECEALPLLRSLLRSGNVTPTARINALMTFWRLAESPHCRRAVTRVECLRPLVQQLAHVDNQEELHCVLMTLVALASADINSREALGRAKAIDTLVQLIQQKCESGSPTRPVAFRLLALLLSAPNVVAALNEACFRFLVSFSHDDGGDIVCSRYVLFALASIFAWSEDEAVEHPANDISDPEDDSSTGQTVSLTSENSRDRGHLDAFLDDSAHLDIVFGHIDAEGFPMDSSHVYLQLLLLYNLSFRFSKADVATRVASSCRLTTFATVSQSAGIHALIGGILFSLCQDYAVHHVLHQSKLLLVLDLLILHPDATTRTTCLEVVCILFDGGQLTSCDLIDVVERLTPALVRLCADGRTEKETRAGCAACFARFVSLEACRNAAVRHGVIGSLAILANDEDPQILRLCVHSYAHLSRDTTICAQLIQSGIIKSLTNLSAAPEEAVRRACAMTLCNLSLAERNVPALAKAGALRALLVISCVKSNDRETRRVCTQAVVNLLHASECISRLCQDGLLWAFGLFAGDMEPQDYDMICDAFCALTFYQQTRKCVVKPALLTGLLQILPPHDVSATTKVKLLKGLSNALCDVPHASQLLHVGVLSHLIALIPREPSQARSTEQQDLLCLLAQLLVLLFQSSPDAESEFAQPGMLQAIARMLQTEPVDDCARCCAMLLYQMSLHDRTRLVLMDEPAILATLPRLLGNVTKEVQALLLRLIYNISCDRELLHRLSAQETITCLGLTLATKKLALLPIDTLVLGAGLLRNLSSNMSTHEALLQENTTTLLQRLYDFDNNSCREDVAVCLCNLFLGRVNSHALLERSVLPIILWLCSHNAVANQALGTAVLRKLALAPGNTQILVDGGTISHLALLVQDSSCLYVKKNCLAVFCCLTRKSDVAAVLASYGVIAVILELLEGGDCADDTLFEAMCIDLLSSLAAFARSDDPRESKLSSLLYQLIEGDDRVAPSSAGAWQSDRGFLTRDDSGFLSPPSFSIAHERVAVKRPTLRHTLYPARLPSFAADFTRIGGHSMELRPIEPIAPGVEILGEGGSSDASLGLTDQVAPSRLDITPLPMYDKLRTPFPALVDKSVPFSPELVKKQLLL